MSTIDPTDPFVIVAQEFMARKGYRDLFPFEEEKLDDACTYLYYELPEGDLELEVSWNAQEMTWDTLVTGFKLVE